MKIALIHSHLNARGGFKAMLKTAKYIEKGNLGYLEPIRKGEKMVYLRPYHKVQRR